MTVLSQHRLKQVREAIADSGADALVLTHLPNIFYLCGFSGSNAILLVLGDAIHLFTDGRYTIQAREEAPQASVHIVRNPLAEACGEFLRSRSPRKRMRFAFESASLSVVEWTRLKKAAGRGIEWKPTTELMERIREVKSAEELDAMRRSARLASEVISEAPDFVRPGVAELDVAAEIDYRLRRKGASGPSFETIVASGPRSALPHARPTEKRLQKNELVVLDLGAILRHYCSDLTRTVFLGRAPARVRRWYKAVEQAQEAAQHALRAGVAAGSVDRAARRLLNQHGLGQYFVHGTGHGLGIEIHEGPRVGRSQKQEIRAGNVVTLEPGIYVEGVGGIRIEDEVAVHADRTEVLTTAPRGLLEL
ncbi:MAG: aminopeptidase P family protein [Acidobacteria bacterium]|nr:MAG: aminopeptidase P family protein [Acidobacteriota bacterium]